MLLTQKLEPIGTRIFGPVTRELRNTQFMKIISWRRKYFEAVMRKFRKGDQVVVITGRDKGRQGAIILVPDDEHVVVEGINLVKRHQRPNPQAGKQGGIPVQGNAAARGQDCDLESGHQEGRSGRLQGAGGRQEGTTFQFERRDARRMMRRTFK